MTTLRNIAVVNEEGSKGGEDVLEASVSWKSILYLLKRYDVQTFLTFSIVKSQGENLGVLDKQVC